MDWKKHFAEVATTYEETDFLRQVEKTVAGQPISPAELQTQVESVAQGLGLSPEDTVLDLCCGNGIMTTRIATACSRVVGIDFAEPLVRIALKYHNPANVSYYCMGVLDPAVRTLPELPFTKVYMYDSLQHFSEDEWPALLDQLLATTAPGSVAFFGGVPDIDRIWEFYNTEERRQDYYRRKREGREAIGTWWNRLTVERAALEKGFECDILPQPPSVNTAHYRFNVRLTRHPDRDLQGP